MERATNHYPALDGFRGLAVLLVFCTHYEVQLLGLDKMGWIGVDMFFVLSGFLITGILFDSRERAHNVRDFYMRRVLRIFPLYYGLLIPIFLTYFYFRWQLDWRYLFYPLHLGNVVKFVFWDGADPLKLTELRNGSHHLKFLMNHLTLGHLWSLSVEEQFYLFWPVVVLSRLSRKTLLKICYAAILLTPVVRWALFSTVRADWLEAGFIYVLTPARVDGFLLGGALALMLRGDEAQWLRDRARFAIPVIYVAFAAFYMKSWLAPWQRDSVHDWFGNTLGYTLLAFTAGALLLQATTPGTIAYRVLRWEPLRSLGGVSYGFYIFHYLFLYQFIAIGFVLSARWHAWTTAAVALVGSLALSYLSFRYFETPFLKLKSRFAHQVHRAPVVKV